MKTLSAWMFVLILPKLLCLSIVTIVVVTSTAYLWISLLYTCAWCCWFQVFLLALRRLEGREAGYPSLGCQGNCRVLGPAGRGVTLNLAYFNLALLEKWWWECCSCSNPIWSISLLLTICLALIWLHYCTLLQEKSPSGKLCLSIEQPSLLAWRHLSKTGVILHFGKPLVRWIHFKR